MKNLFKKGAVAAAVAGSLMVSGLASADSVLAPLVIGLNNPLGGGVQTYFSIKMRGNGTVDSGGSASSKLHYRYFRKGTSLASLRDFSTPCQVSNNRGTGSAWDMIYQRAVKANGTLPNFDLLGAEDLSTPNGYSNAGGNFVGFMTISDEANLQADPNVKDLANEGELSGFAYVVDPTNNLVLDYKLINNHRSKVDNVFNNGFIAKNSVDFSWLPRRIARSTQWLVLAVNDDMKLAEQTSNGQYDATVFISQDTPAGGVSPSLPSSKNPLVLEGGVYNNDETVASGPKSTYVTCMGLMTKSDVMQDSQVNATLNGGWKRMAITGSSKRAGDAAGLTASSTDAKMSAKGALVYKAEVLTFAQGNGVGAINTEALASDGSVQDQIADDMDGNVGGKRSVNGLTGTLGEGGVFDFDNPTAEQFDPIAQLSSRVPGYVVSFQSEVGGHLSKVPEPHPNRPF